jgi:hypothetical protein
MELVMTRHHKQRNLTEYEGHLEITSHLIKELVEIIKESLKSAQDLSLIVNNK